MAILATYALEGSSQESIDRGTHIMFQKWTDRNGNPNNTAGCNLSGDPRRDPRWHNGTPRIKLAVDPGVAQQLNAMGVRVWEIPEHVNESNGTVYPQEFYVECKLKYFTNPDGTPSKGNPEIIIYDPQVNNGAGVVQPMETAGATVDMYSDQFAIAAVNCVADVVRNNNTGSISMYVKSLHVRLKQTQSPSSFYQGASWYTPPVM